jgi:hypothetical protein
MGEVSAHCADGGVRAVSRSSALSNIASNVLSLRDPSFARAYHPFAFMWAFTASRNASARREGLRWARAHGAKEIADARLERHHGDAGAEIVAGGERIDDRDAETARGERAGIGRGIHVDLQLALDPLLLEGSIDQMAHAAVEREGQEAFAAQVGRPDHLAPRQPMAARQHADRRRAAQLLRDHRRMLERHHREAEIDLLVDHLLVDVGRAADLEDDVRLGVALHECGHDVGQDAAPERRRRIDQQVADLALADLARHLRHALQAVIEPGHFLFEKPGLAGRRQPPLDAGEQRVADLVLQSRQDLAYRRLRDAQPLRRGRHRPVRHDGAKGFELTRRDHHNLDELTMPDNDFDRPAAQAFTHSCQRFCV